MHPYNPALPLLCVSLLPYLNRTKLPNADPYFTRARQITLALKHHTPTATLQIAQLTQLTDLQHFNGLLVPAPRSTPYRPLHTYFCNALHNYGVGARTETLLRRTHAIPSSRRMRQTGHSPPSLQQQLSTLSAHLPDEHRRSPILLVDDVLTTGTTIAACAIALRRNGHIGPIAALTAARYTNTPKHFRRPPHSTTIIPIACVDRCTVPFQPPPKTKLRPKRPPPPSP